LSQPGTAHKIAVVNSSSAVIDLLRTFLEGEGYETVTLHVEDVQAGNVDLIEFLTRHNPPVVLYDISMPYEQNWNFFKLFRDTEVCRNRRFVITTTNKERLEALVGPTEAIEIVGKPFDLQQVRDAIEGASGR
jgi:CheY-like chemotaxis protein